MPAPRCTCEGISTRLWGVEIIRCPLHEAAGDLYTTLEALLKWGERGWNRFYYERAMPEDAQGEDEPTQARAALLKANPHYAQEVE